MIYLHSMLKILKIFKPYLPKKIIKIISNLMYPPVKYKGPFDNWNDAKSFSSGWSDKKILEKVYKSLIKSFDMKGVYERDGELVNDLKYPENIINFLNSNLNENGQIIDFGGSLGSLYFQIRSKLLFKNIKWSVLEQSNYVELGKRKIKNKELDFFNNVDETQVNNNTILIFSSVLQYLENPEKVINLFLNTKFIEHVVVDRVILSNSKENKIYIQKNPKKYFNTSYPIIIFSEKIFLNYFKKMKIVIKDKSYVGENFELDNAKLYYCNIIFSRVKGS